MYSILEEFAYGNISPEVQCFKRNSEYANEMKISSSNEQKLLNSLGEGDKVLFQKYVHAQGEINRITAVENFMYGYKLGLLMTAEAFVTSKEYVVG